MFSHMMPYFTWFFLKYPCEWFYILTIIGMYWSKICPSFLLLSTRLLFHCPSALVERFSFRIWSILQRFSWHTRGVFRTPSNIYDGFFFAKIERFKLKGLNYFHKKLHLRWLTGFWMRHCTRLIPHTLLRSDAIGGMMVLYLC